MRRAAERKNTIRTRIATGVNKLNILSSFIKLGVSPQLENTVYFHSVVEIPRSIMNIK
jgi:hypothetical protein